MNTAQKIIIEWTIADLGEEYDLLGEDDFRHFCELRGVAAEAEQEGLRGGFALLGDGDIIALYGFEGIIPELRKTVFLLYHEQIEFELSYTYSAIGQLWRTSRYPSRQHFISRSWEYIKYNYSSVRLDRVAKLAHILAFNSRYIRVGALELAGLDRDDYRLRGAKV